MKTTTELLRWFYSNYPRLVEEMRNCDHNLSYDEPNSYHLEGDVWCHVMMILKQIQQANYLTDYDKYIYSVIALCHDLGKPEARQIRDGKVTFYNHDAISAFKAIEVLNHLALSQEEKEVIFQTIAHHTQVFRLTRQQLFDKLLDAKLRNTIETFGVFDHDGRFHDNQEVEKSYTLCEDLVVKYSSQNAPKTVTVMVGLPASGKSTYIEQNASEGSFIVSRDRIVEDLGDGITYSEKWYSANQKEVDEVLQEVFKQAKKENEVFVDMTHLSTKSRRRTLSHFGKEWKKKCVVVLPSLTQLTNNSEYRKNTTGKFVSDSVVLEMMSRFSSPTYSEGFDEIEWRF
jgi:predicted kinase